MDEKLEDKLVKKYPILFQDASIDPSSSMSTFGIEFSSGWYELLDNCCNSLSELNQEFKFVQLKEKFGLMRIYVDRTSDEIERIIRETELKSSKCCEICGSKEHIQTKGSWLKTLCDKCRKNNAT